MTDKPADDHIEEGSSVARCENASGEKMATIPKSGVDEALQIALDSQEETWTEQEERRVLWKVDLVIVPLVGQPHAEYPTALITPLYLHTY
jgi:ACS family allantoate permease-like MFS transporter